MNFEIPFKQPVHQATAFNCPYCKAYSKMVWNDARTYNMVVEWIEFAQCTHCGKYSIWYEEELIYPEELTVDSPSKDLPAQVKKVYLEAASIVSKSPRGASALLRLAIQKLCDELVEGDQNLNTKIGILVKQGLNKKVQQALDVVRVVGNDAVHPGVIDLNDKPDVAAQLFKLVNIISDQMISEPKEIDEMYESLPQEKKQQVEKRDNKK